MDAASFERYNKENQEVIDLALKVNSKAGKAIKHVKTVAQANIQDAADTAQSRDKTVRVRAELRPDVLSINATLIEFREWLTTFKSYFYGSNLQNDHITGQQAIYKQLLDTELRRRVAPECGADTQVLLSAKVVQPFNPAWSTVVLTDASRLNGIGFALVQYDPTRVDTKKHFALVQCGSSSLTSAQGNYATIELECLAIQYALYKSEFYLRGLPNFAVWTDHRPLVGIFNKALHTPCQRLHVSGSIGEVFVSSIYNVPCMHVRVL